MYTSPARDVYTDADPPDRGFCVHKHQLATQAPRVHTGAGETPIAAHVADQDRCTPIAGEIPTPGVHPATRPTPTTPGKLRTRKPADEPIRKAEHTYTPQIEAAPPCPTARRRRPTTAAPPRNSHPRSLLQHFRPANVASGHDGAALSLELAPPHRRA